MNLLGYNFRPDGLRPQEDRIKAVVEAKVAKTKTGILRFLGLVRYYQRFVPHLSELSQPLTSLLRKDRSIKEWGPEQDSAVAKIKEVFASADVLTHFKEGRQTVLMTDASHYAMGAVLSQIVDEEGTEKPICFLSKTFDRHQINYTVTEKECLAVVWATESLRTLLQGQTFILETDHDALRYLIQSKDAVGRLARWAMKLQQFDMVVKYRKGEENGAADYVSRLHQLPDGTYEIGRAHV